MYYDYIWLLCYLVHFVHFVHIDFQYLNILPDFAWFSICCISRPLESRLSTLELQLREARETESPGAQRQRPCRTRSDLVGPGRTCEGRLRSRAWPRWNASCGRDRTDLFRHPTECHRMPQNATEGQLDMSVIATCNDRQTYCMYGWTKQRHQRHSKKKTDFLTPLSDRKSMPGSCVALRSECWVNPCSECSMEWQRKLGSKDHNTICIDMLS